MYLYKTTAILAITLCSLNLQASNIEYVCPTQDEMLQSLHKASLQRIHLAKQLELIDPSEENGYTTQLHIDVKYRMIEPETINLSAEDLQAYIPIITKTINKIAQDDFKSKKQDNFKSKKNKNDIPTDYLSRKNKHGHSITSPYYLCEHDTYEEFIRKSHNSVKEKELPQKKSSRLRHHTKNYKTQISQN